MQTPFSPLSFGKSFMKIRSAVPENGCLAFLWRTDGKKSKKKHLYIRIRLIGGCVNNSNARSRCGPGNAHFISIRQVSLAVDFRYFATY